MPLFIVENLALTLQTLGTLFVAYAALRVHHRFLTEHQIDEKVFTSMKREQAIGLMGVTLIIIGYLVAILS